MCFNTGNKRGAPSERRYNPLLIPFQLQPLLQWAHPHRSTNARPLPDMHFPPTVSVHTWYFTQGSNTSTDSNDTRNRNGHRSKSRLRVSHIAAPTLLCENSSIEHCTHALLHHELTERYTARIQYYFPLLCVCSLVCLDQ